MYTLDSDPGYTRDCLGLGPFTRLRVTRPHSSNDSTSREEPCQGQPLKMKCVRPIARNALRRSSPRCLRPFATATDAPGQQQPSFDNRVKIVEVGPRDGLQNEKTMVPLATKVELIERLARTGLTTIEAGSFVSPKWVPQASRLGGPLPDLIRKLTTALRRWTAPAKF